MSMIKRTLIDYRRRSTQPARHHICLADRNVPRTTSHNDNGNEDQGFASLANSETCHILLIVDKFVASHRLCWNDEPSVVCDGLVISRSVKQQDT